MPTPRKKSGIDYMPVSPTLPTPCRPQTTQNRTDIRAMHWPLIGSAMIFRMLGVLRAEYKEAL